ncbi:MAG: UDP-2,3-diacylglucosamine diphosphatase [Bacteroidota bacterium]
MTTRYFRTIWISDLHLGTRGCQADAVLDFLRHTDSERLYLVGDLVDGWALRRGWHWPQAHNDVVQKLLRKARKGTQVVYVPGNHDDFAHHFTGLTFGEIEITRDAFHDTADGRILLVLHGDQFDGAVRLAPWLSHVGARAYEATLALNTGINRARRAFGRPYWSLAGYLKGKTKKAVQYVAGFEEAVARRARERDVDGIVCGHIHKAELRPIGGILYANCGDWVESCTALVEHDDGRLELVRWPALPEAEGLTGDGLATGLPVLDTPRPS